MAKAATRLSPLDGKNLNRSFPGRADGTMTEIIAHYLTTVLFPLADIVIDIHTGGRSTDFVPCAHMHLVPAGPQRDAMLAGTEAWNSEFCFLYADIAGTGLLPVEAERQGKTVITTEMGGSENVTAQVHCLTQSGLRNVLIQTGVLQGEFLSRQAAGVDDFTCRTLRRNDLPPGDRNIVDPPGTPSAVEYGGAADQEVEHAASIKRKRAFRPAFSFSLPGVIRLVSLWRCRGRAGLSRLGSLGA